MRRKLENYIKKYSTLENLKAFGSQEEKDDYLLIERSLLVSYDDHFLQIQHNLDNLINHFIDCFHDKQYHFIEDDDPLFSLYSTLKFEGKVNLYNPNDYMTSLPRQAVFSSLYQYLIYHKSILFLDRQSAKKILKTKLKCELILLEKGIKNIDEGVWSKYRIEIVETGVRELMKSNKEFKSALQNKTYGLLVFLSHNSFWGVNPLQKDRLGGVRNNYFGKILTKICLELQEL